MDWSVWECLPNRAPRVILKCRDFIFFNRYYFPIPHSQLISVVYNHFLVFIFFRLTLLRFFFLLQASFTLLFTFLHWLCEFIFAIESIVWAYFNMCKRYIFTGGAAVGVRGWTKEKKTATAHFNWMGHCQWNKDTPKTGVFEQNCRNLLKIKTAEVNRVAVLWRHFNNRYKPLR